MLAFKQKVQRDFSVASSTYHEKAAWQRSVATQLLRYADGAITAPILDVGCGTGFIAEQLKEANILQIDIASGMVRQAQAFAPAVVMDMEQLGVKQTLFRTVTSSLAVQWAREFNSVCEGVSQVLPPGGYFVFSTLVKGTLAELRSVTEEGKVLTFLDQAEIKSTLTSAGFVDIRMQLSEERREYPDLKALLQEIKGVGAAQKPIHSSGLVGKMRFRRISDIYRERYSCGNGVYATWNVLYVTARKP